MSVFQVSVTSYDVGSKVLTMCHHHPTQHMGRDHQVQRIQSKHKWFLLCTSLFPRHLPVFNAVPEGAVPSVGLQTGTKTPEAMRCHPGTPRALKPHGLRRSVQLLPCPANWALRTRSRRKHIFDITQHDNFSRVREMQSIQINLNAETISLFIRICTCYDQGHCRRLGADCFSL